jgi:deoxyribose-phosphate aldolase
VILETGALKTPERIYNASLLSMEAGADFIKTSTGKLEPAATLDAMLIMCKAIKLFNSKKNKKIGIKPAGGISTSEEALKYFTIVAEVLGEEYLNNQLFRIGASKLANNILAKVKGNDVDYFGEKPFVKKERSKEEGEKISEQSKKIKKSKQ